MISGCTSSGKTTFVKKLLEHPELFEPRPQKILYCYGAWQALFEDMKSTFKDIEFHGGLPDSELRGWKTQHCGPGRSDVGHHQR